MFQLYLIKEFWTYAHFDTADVQQRDFDVKILETVILVRVLRIFAFLNELEQWQFFMKAFKIMRGPFFNLCFTLYSLYFMYSLIGMQIYGGKINSQTFEALFELNPGSEIGPDYIYLNFNDFASGLITLFSMMLFNNWQFIWEQFDFAIESKVKTNCFFLSFMVMATYVIINIIMAFIIDVYTSIEDAEQEEKAERKEIEKLGREAVAEQRRELADQYKQSVGEKLRADLKKAATKRFSRVERKGSASKPVQQASVERITGINDSLVDEAE